MMRALMILTFAMLAASSHALSNTRLTEWYVPQAHLVLKGGAPSGCYEAGYGRRWECSV